MGWLEIITLLSILISVVLEYRNISLKRQQNVLASSLIQSEIDKDILKKQMLQTIEDKKLVESEEFMMFLNKSREAAFSYIEEVQAGILKFNTAIYEANINSNDPNQTLTKILDANKELQKLLPSNK